MENAKYYKQLEENSDLIVENINKRDELLYNMGQAVAFAYIMHNIDVYDININEVRRYVYDCMKDNKELRDCYFETLKDIK